MAVALECLAQCYKLVWQCRPQARVRFVVALHFHGHPDAVIPGGPLSADDAETVHATTPFAHAAVLAHARDVQVRDGQRPRACNGPHACLVDLNFIAPVRPRATDAGLTAARRWLLDGPHGRIPRSGPRLWAVGPSAGPADGVAGTHRTMAVDPAGDAAKRRLPHTWPQCPRGSRKKKGLTLWPRTVEVGP